MTKISTHFYCLLQNTVTKLPIMVVAVHHQTFFQITVRRQTKYNLLIISNDFTTLTNNGYDEQLMNKLQPIYPSFSSHNNIFLQLERRRGNEPAMLHLRLTFKFSFDVFLRLLLLLLLLLFVRFYWFCGECTLL
jgi:hypothetical protein